MKIKTLLKTMLILPVALAFGACSDDNDDDVSPDNVPAEFKTALSQLYPEAKKVEWENKGQYRVAEFDNGNGQVGYEIWFNPKAELAMTNKDYGKNLFYLPTSVNDSYEATEYGSAPWAVDDIDEYQIGTVTFYVIESEAQGKPDVYQLFNSEGTIVSTYTGSIPEITPDFKLPA